MANYMQRCGCGTWTDRAPCDACQIRDLRQRAEQAKRENATLRGQVEQLTTALRAAAAYMSGLMHTADLALCDRCGIHSRSSSRPYCRKCTDALVTEALSAIPAPAVAPESTTVHDLKCWPDSFQALKCGDKTCEWRKDDRNYKNGHFLRLREYMPMLAQGEDMGGYYSGQVLNVRVTDIQRGPDWDIPDGYVMMSVRPATPAPPDDTP